MFSVAKAVVLRCNIGTFAEQNRLFCDAKQGVLQSVGSKVVTRQSAFGEMFTVLWGVNKAFACLLVAINRL